MNRYRYFAFPAYLAAFALIVIPFADSAMSLWPWRPGLAQWRFGALGLTSNAFMVPAAGAVILLATALTLGHWRTLRVFGVICAIGALVVGSSIFIFALDAIQSSVNVQAAAKQSFKIASITAGAKLLLGSLTLAAFAIAGLKTKSDKQKVVQSAPVVTAKPRAEAVV